MNANIIMIILTNITVEIITKLINKNDISFQCSLFFKNIYLGFRKNKKQTEKCF